MLSIFQVQFKVASGNYSVLNTSTANFAVGDYVVVEADRGEDVGVITSCQLRHVSSFDSLRSENPREESPPRFRQIYRFASILERNMLAQKEQDENQAIQVCNVISCYLFRCIISLFFKVCEDLLNNLYEIPVQVVDAEFQFDRKKLTVYYGSEYSVNFRPFIRELYCLYKSRIWLERVYSTQQQSNSNPKPVPSPTGYYSPLQSPKMPLIESNKGNKYFSQHPLQSRK